MKQHFIFLVIGLFLFSQSLTYAQEQLLPLNSAFKDELILASDSSSSFVGTGLFPVAEGTVTDKLYRNEVGSPRKTWFGRKLFDEHFVEIKGDDYFLAIDPLIHGAVGQERGLVQTNLFLNTRAFQVTGEVLNNVSFYTAFFENQARFASYQRDYFSSRGELYLKAFGYSPQNAVVPGGGRTKDFKEGGFDYASAVSHVRYRPFERLAIQFGNTPNFIGWGHRSLLLSDNSFVATTLRFDVKITDKISFTRLNSKYLNLMRRAVTTKVEAPYEKKNYSANYLTYKPTDNLTIGLFEATVYFREDSIFSQSVHPLYFNPIPLVNTSVFGWESADAKSLVGINVAYQLGQRNLIFGQLVTDQLGSVMEYGVQLGWRTNSIFGIENLFTHLEYNKASDRLYAANNRRMSYTHFNLPLAHTLGNGFDEVIARAGYSFKSIYVEGHASFYKSNQKMDQLESLFDEKWREQEVDSYSVLLGNLEIGYCFNPRTKLSAFTKVTIRQSTSELFGEHNAMLVTFGVKTRIFNQYTDF